MPQILPTITAENSHQYREQIERVQAFTKKLHIDVMDGIFTPNKSLAIDQVWLPDQIECDIHVMFKHPLEAVREFLALGVRTLIVPAESEDDFNLMHELIHEEGVKFGVALLAETSVDDAKDVISRADHVLIFSGNLGHQGGSTADLSLLSKIAEIKALNSSAEIGWDGGVNSENIKQIAAVGVDVINVGGDIHYARNPELQYETLLQQIS